jgi:hydroxylaminobenzene mutase
VQAQIDLRLARHGAILLLLGMLTGFVIRHFNNEGAGNAAHLVGLIGGYGLMAVALLWPRLSLGRWSSAGAWITAGSLYLNWMGVVLVMLGSGPKPAGAAFPGSPPFWNDAAFVVLKTAVALSLLSVLLILAGLRKLPAREVSPEAGSAAMTSE